MFMHDFFCSRRQLPKEAQKTWWTEIRLENENPATGQEGKGKRDPAARTAWGFEQSQSHQQLCPLKTLPCLCFGTIPKGICARCPVGISKAEETSVYPGDTAEHGLPRTAAAPSLADSAVPSSGITRAAVPMATALFPVKLLKNLFIFFPFLYFAFQ